MVLNYSLFSIVFIMRVIERIDKILICWLNDKIVWFHRLKTIKLLEFKKFLFYNFRALGWTKKVKMATFMLNIIILLNFDQNILVIRVYNCWANYFFIFIIISYQGCTLPLLFILYVHILTNSNPRFWFTLVYQNYFYYICYPQVFRDCSNLN